VNGSFINPVIAGFHPDPSICRVGTDYYLACSSFEYSPGVPIFRSQDLVHWDQIGNVLENYALAETTPSSGGIYAPTLRYHDGRFWLITTDVSGSGTVLLTASDPAGPWSEPVRVPAVSGFDPDLAWDDEGRCWCTYAGIEQVQIDPATGQALGEPRHLWSGTPGAQWPEAPHLCQIGDYWYLMIAEGGTERGHCVSVARGPAPDGPFEACPANPVLTHRSTGQPIQSTGHADLVEGPDGSWWMVLLGVRLRGDSPGWHVMGRETYLAPVTWAGGWPSVGEVTPVMAAPGWPVGPADEQPVRDDFGGQRLHPRWISPRSLPAECGSLADGWLTLGARGGSLDDADVTFVGRRQQHLSCRVRALADLAAGRGGLAVRLDERHHYEVEAGDGKVRALARIGPLRQTLGTLAIPPGPVVLRIEVHEAPGRGPDTLYLGAEDPGGRFTALAELDGRYLSTEVAGGFTGRVIGMYCTAGTTRFDWFDYEALLRPTTAAGPALRAR
jgi:xylan 1,4-beta-xylosidase